MKIAVFRGAGLPLQLEEAPDPTPERDQVVVKIHRCGICGSDLHMTSGHGVNFPPGTVLGHEITGEVVAVGGDVTRFKTGDFLVPHAFGGGCGRCDPCRKGEPQWCTAPGNPSVGGYGQYALVRAQTALKLPAGISPADGALVEPLACSLHGLRLANMEKGSRVLIIGAGPIGLGAAYWAKLMGAGRIAVMARSTRRRSLAMRMGADVFLAGPRAETPQDLEGALGGMPDLVVECAGAPGVLTSAIELVRPRGTIVSLGMCVLPDSYNPFLAVMKEVTVRFGLLYSLDEYQRVVDAFTAGHVEPRHMISDTIPLEKLPETFEALRQPNDSCKVLVDPWATA
jgi:(R,R)-butanediol dehydrogenase/meso-butanediol dehydrogenase/diacetyl reductase